MYTVAFPKAKVVQQMSWAVLWDDPWARVRQVTFGKEGDTWKSTSDSSMSWNGDPDVHSDILGEQGAGGDDGTS